MPEINTYDCNHIFPDGHRCGSPHLRNQLLCFNHDPVRRLVTPPAMALPRIRRRSHGPGELRVERREP